MYVSLQDVTLKGLLMQRWLSVKNGYLSKSDLSKTAVPRAAVRTTLQQVAIYRPDQLLSQVRVGLIQPLGPCGFASPAEPMASAA